MHTLVHKILENADAPRMLEELQHAMEEERKRRLEFYQTMTEQEKTEFINGEVVVHSPVKKNHNRATALLHRLLDIYAHQHQLGFVGIEKILVRLTRNDYEPDVCFFNKEKSDSFAEDQMFFPAPDFVAEVISPSTEKIDRGIKFYDYAQHGVQEYWIIDPEQQTVEQYLLENGAYKLSVKVKDGVLESEAITGFKIPVKAIFDNDENAKAIGGMMNSYNA